MQPVFSEERNPYRLGRYAPIETEITAANLEVLGEIPRDLFGLMARNGTNPHFNAKGRYHWFDGDGMMHAVWFENGQATYRNRYIRTEALQRELAAGESLWRGIRESTRHNPSDLPFKDTANTDVVFYNGHLLALWYISGKPYKLNPRTLETIGIDDFGGQRTSNVSAHAKVDEHTGELLFFDYGITPPFMTYGVVSNTGELKHFIPIELPAPRLPHDMAMTEHYSILMDLPICPDPAAISSGHWVARFDRNLPARFGVIPRYGAGSSIRWFEAESCYIYHSINAYEDGDEIVLTACRLADPMPELDPNLSQLEHVLAILQLQTTLHRWRFNLKTGTTKEEQLDDVRTEFPTLNLWHLGRRSRFSYNVHFAPEATVAFDGIVKYDTDTGASETHWFGSGRFGNEAPFAPRVNATSEDDGYVLSFVHDDHTNQSELWILDAQNFTKPPIGRVQIPQRVPMGFHATWVPGERLAQL